MKLFRKIPFHPVLWSLFAPLALLGNNIGQVSPGDAVRTLIVSFMMCVLVWVVLRLIMRSWGKSAVVTTGFVILFFSYGHLYHLIEDVSFAGINIGRHRFLIPIFILALALIFFWTLRRADVFGINGALNMVVIIVLIFPLYQIISYEIKTSSLIMGSPQEKLLSEVANLRLPSGEEPPDIYYIILDSYTRGDNLSINFSQDNQGFLNDLKGMGFYIADCSQSNYSYTAVSLASSLNYNYIETLDSNLISIKGDETAIYPYLFNNAVTYTLRRLGYKFVAFESGYSPTEFTKADTYYSQGSDLLGIILQDGINPFESMQLNTSAGMFIYEYSSHLPTRLQQILSLDTAYVVHRNRILYTLNRLERIGATPGPKFVFVHILAPHNPFVFGANGDYIKRKTPFTLNDDRDVVMLQDYITGYDAQVTYLNQRILGIVNSLIRDSNRPPVIIIQGDHGPPRITGWNDTILNGYYLPEAGDAKLYPSISPVNTFRVIFDTYFSGNLPLLPDRACSANANTNPFACISTPDPNPQCAAISSSHKP